MAFDRLNWASSNNPTQRGTRADLTGVADGPPRIHNYRTDDLLVATATRTGIFPAGTLFTDNQSQTTAYFNKRKPSTSDNQRSDVVEDWLGIFPICPQGDIIEIVSTALITTPAVGDTDATNLPVVGVAATNTVSFHRLLCQGYAPVGGIDQPIFTDITR